MTYKGKIFKIPFPFTDLSGFKARPALAVSEPDEYGDLEFLFITTKQARSFEVTLELAKDVYIGHPLPFDSLLHIDKTYLLSKDIIIKELADISEVFLETVMRSIVLRDVRKHYEVKHASKKQFTPGDRIPYAGRIFDEKEVTTLVDSSLDFWLTTGRYAERFERELAAFLDAQHCSLVNSGSSANLLAFMALTSPKLGERRIRPGDEVISVAAAFPTTVAPIIQFGAVPVFVDVSLPGYNIDVTRLAGALSDRTKAVMIAHTLGNPFDLAAVKAFCDTHKLWLIEDNCDALGSRYQLNGVWKYTGTIGHIGTSSFYPPHHMTMGEGGAVYTNDALLHRIIESFRDWGRDCWCPSGKDNTCSNRFGQQFGELPYGYDHKYVYSHFGYNLKATDMQAAIGCAQLEKFPGFVEARKKNWRLLRDDLTGLEERLILPEATENSDPSWFGFLMTVKNDSGFTRDQIVTHLESKGIQTRMLFAGNLIKHPCFDDMRKAGTGYRIAGDLHTTDQIMNNTFWLGVYPGMTEDMVMYMIETIGTFVKGR
jgi:CDP-6-deoxy-D-xylo-4-hexulose-3-dehydrase